MRATWALAGLLLGVGCGSPPPQAWAPPDAPDPEVAEIQRQLARPFVVFAASDLVIDRLGEPLDAPVSVGSRPSPATLVSESPHIVRVDQAGRLVAQQDGRAVIRGAPGGSALAVTVRVASSVGGRALAAALQPGGAQKSLEQIAVRPSRARLLSGQVQAFEAMSPSGPVPVVWTSSNSEIVALVQDHIFQAANPGTARVCAGMRGGRACAVVEVTR